MRILEIINDLSSGGAERLVVDLSNEMAKWNEVTLMTLWTENTDNLFYRSNISETVKSRNLGLGRGRSLKSMWKIYKACREERPDILHIHSSPSFFCILAILSRIKIVQTIHNDILLGGYNTRRYKWLFHIMGIWKRIRFVAISSTNYNDLKRMHPYCDCYMVTNGRAPQVATELLEEVRYELENLRKNKDSILLLNVARCVEAKNHKLLIEAVRQLNEEDADIDVAIIGSGYDNTDLGNELTSLAGNRIHFLGTRKNIADYMYAADAVCLSSYYEGMPITLIEAMLCGTPAISTPVCGAIDSIVDGQNGILSKDFSVAEYKNAIRRFIQNRKTITDSAKSMLLSADYSIANCAKQYDKIFKSLIDCK